MTVHSSQPGLFDTVATPDREPSEHAIARMNDMIDRLAAASAPPWKNQCDVILADGAFRRAMRLVPELQANQLWQKFDAQMERLYALWETERYSGIGPK